MPRWCEVAQDGRGPPVLMVSAPPRPGRRGFYLRGTNTMAMLHGLRGRLSLSHTLRFLYFWSRARPEIDHLSGLFVLSPVLTPQCPPRLLSP
jgi:hypothetical protein